MLCCVGRKVTLSPSSSRGGLPLPLSPRNFSVARLCWEGSLAHVVLQVCSGLWKYVGGWGAWCGLWPSAGQPRSSFFLRSLPRGPSEAGASRDLGPGPKPMTLPYPDSLGGTWASPDPGGWEVYLPYHLDERQSHVVGCGCWGLRRRLPLHRQPCPTPRWGI